MKEDGEIQISSLEYGYVNESEDNFRSVEGIC
jgi:hypothetical protein